MLISQPDGLYTISYDATKKLVKEAPVGLWTKEEYIEYHSQFVNKIGPALGGQPWAIRTDLRKYKVSDLGEVMAKHTEWLANNNLSCGAIIVDSAIVKMQINRAISSKFTQQNFLTEEEADEWLKQKGF
ncbi:MAG: hypothetical protein ACK5JH_01430 [Anaerocolumna sp.]